MKRVWSADPSELPHLLLLYLHLQLHLHWMLRCCPAVLCVLVAMRLFFQGTSAVRYRTCRVLSTRVPQVMGWTQGLKKTKVFEVP